MKHLSSPIAQPASVTSKVPVRSGLLYLALVIACTCDLPAQSLEPGAVKKLAADYFRRQPTETITAGLSLAEARRIQNDFVRLLTPKLGERVGYKVGLTSKAVQESVGASAPVRGVLLKQMLLTNAVTVPHNFGARPIYEADLIVIVKDAGINKARTPMEIASHLTHVVAFIELPDRVVHADAKLDGNVIAAINAGARLGVLGERVSVEATPEFIAALGAMTIVATDQTGTELIRARADALLGHPLNAVQWLLTDLAATGESLRAGDIVSLGSFARPEQPKPGQTITVRYEGLPGGPLKATVHFKE